MKQDVLFDGGNGHAGAETDQAETDVWPAHWAWEDDNSADGLGVGPFPTGRKPPKRAERHTPPYVRELFEDDTPDDD